MLSHQIIKFWRARTGGWSHGVLLKTGHKWAWVKEFGPRSKRRRIPLDDVDVLPDGSTTTAVEELAAEMERVAEQHQVALEAQLKPLADQLQLLFA